MKFTLSAILSCATLAVASVLLSSPALACSNSSHGLYVQPDSTKPLIELNKLNTAQIAELEAYAAKLKAEVATIKAEAEKVDKSTMDNDARSNAQEATAKLIEEAAARLGEEVSFRTIVTVGNGMLCGASIKVEIPMARNNMRANSMGIWTFGEGRNGRRAEGLIDPGYIAEIVADGQKR
ncbi:MAG: hypothetical protein WC028_31690 [Candidatus Obscuribacterales bacterium]